jgi:hypothetical protein
MRIKATHLFIFFPAALIILSQGDKMKATVDQGSVITQNESTTSSESRLMREEAKNAQRYSKVALERLKSNCIQTVDKATKQPSYYTPGLVVVDMRLKRPIREGAFVCNAVGETAVIDASGATSKIVRVNLKDKAEYDKLFSQLREGKNGRTNK